MAPSAAQLTVIELRMYSFSMGGIEDLLAGLFCG
jgi:hypothetical protein